MNPARQFLHILLKDIRCRALEIGLVLVLNLGLALVLTETWAESLDRASAGEVMIDNAAQILLAIAWCVLIGRLVQDDGVAGRAPYWLTRPYSRGVLLTSKLAFVLLFVHLPLFLSHLAIVIGSGVPLSFAQMLVDQIVLAACFSLPVMALAALTSTFSRFVFGSVAVVAVTTLVLSVVSTLYPIYAIVAFASVGSLLFLATVLAMLATIAGAALVCQYRWRATLRITVASVVALSLLGLGLLALTPVVVMGIRAAIDRPTTVPTTIRFRETTEPRIINPQDPSNPRLVLVPIDAAATGESTMSTSRVDIRLASGREVEFSGADFDSRSGSGVGIRRNDDGDWLLLVMPPSDYDSLKDELVSLHFIAEIYTYEIRETEPIPRDGSFVIVDGRAQCGVPAIFPLTCRSSSGWAESLVYLEPYAQQWWLPVHLRFSINPIVTRRMANGMLDQVATPDIPTSVRRRVGYTRQDVTFDNIRLGDWGP